MPKEVEIEVFNIARTMIDHNEVLRWLNRLDATEFDWPDQSEVSDPALLIAMAAKRCYMSFQPGLNPNVTRVRQNYVDFFDNILSSGHGSVLEHASYSYAIEGLSRVATAELNRHRAGWAISEGSMRFIRFDENIPYWLPLSLRDADDDDADLRARKEMSRMVFNSAFRQTELLYSELLQIWGMTELDKNFGYKKKVTSCMRRIVPLGVATGGVWTGNIRALRHVIALRTAAAAEEEIAYTFGLIAEDIIKREPLLFGDFDGPLQEPLLFGDFDGPLQERGDAYEPKYYKV
jgi:thymidylate synthase (FAD)